MSPKGHSITLQIYAKITSRQNNMHENQQLTIGKNTKYSKMAHISCTKLARMCAILANYQTKIYLLQSQSNYAVCRNSNCKLSIFAYLSTIVSNGLHISWV